MNRKSFLLTAVASTAMAVLTWSSPAQAATTLKVSSCLIKTHDHVETFLQLYVKPVNDAKSGLTLRYIGGPEVTPRKKQAPALKRGLIDVIFCPTPYYGDVVPEARLPGAHNVSLAEMRKNGAWDMLKEAWAKKLNGYILAFPAFEASTFYIYTKFKPKFSTKTGLDLTGRKMRSTGLYNPLLKAMHATPVTISPGDVYSRVGARRGRRAGLAQGLARQIRLAAFSQVSHRPELLWRHPVRGHQSGQVQ